VQVNNDLSGLIIAVALARVAVCLWSLARQLNLVIHMGYRDLEAQFHGCNALMFSS
jgi:hypothetical protein